MWQCVYPWDIRIEKFTKLLSKQGHEVHIICRGRKELPEKEKIDALLIHRVLISLSIIGVFLSRVLSYPLFINPVWIYKTLKILIKNKIDLIIVRDLPLAFLGGIL